MDLNRYYRALLAGQMQAVDSRRTLFLRGKIKGTDIDEADWNLIVQMDELVED